MGPVVIAYDGSAAAEHALREAAPLFGSRNALVVAVWEEGSAFEVAVPAPAVDMTPPAIDFQTARAIDEAAEDRARALAQRGAALARELGLEADGLAVADEADRSVADTLVEVAERRGAAAVVVGTHGHGRVAEALLGSTTRDLIHRCRRPVLVIRQPDDAG